MKDIKLDQIDQLDRIAQAWSGAIEQLSHALSTKIATLQLKQQGLRKVIPSLLEGYRFAVEASLWHLLTAALQRIRRANKGDIHIWLSDEEKHHVFNIKDTSQGLTDDQRTNLFSHFLFEPYDKTRPGLGFCRLAMLHVSGDIIYYTVDDEGAYFKIMLPKAD